MDKSLIDTDILSLFLRGNANVIKRFKEYLSEYSQLTFSIITYYEIKSGLLFRDSRKQLVSFLEFSKYNSILSVNEHSATISSEIYSDLRKQGLLIDDIDLLIAGIAIANDLVLVTHNTDHFSRIKKLAIQDWAI